MVALTRVVLELEDAAEALHEEEEAAAAFQQPSAGKAVITFKHQDVAEAFRNKTLRTAVVACRVQHLRAAIRARPPSGQATTEELGLGDRVVPRRRASESDELLADLERLRISEWRVTVAPEADDLDWQALHLSPTMYYLRRILSNVVVLACVIALTTPTALLGLIGSTYSTESSSRLKGEYADTIDGIFSWSPVIADFTFFFAPQLVLVLLNTLLVYATGVVVRKFDVYTTYSERATALLHKAYLYLILNTLLLPSLALTSLLGMAKDLMRGDGLALLEGTFVNTSGAFILCYVITQTWMGCAFDVMRVGDSTFRCARRCCFALRRGQGALGSFDFGGEYAQAWTVLTCGVVFSVMVPVISGFSAIFFLLKASTDEFSLRFQCQRRGVHLVARPHVGRAAVGLLGVPILLFQLTVIGFVHSRGTRTQLFFLVTVLAMTLVRLGLFWREDLLPNVSRPKAEVEPRNEEAAGLAPRAATRPVSEVYAHPSLRTRLSYDCDDFAV